LNFFLDNELRGLEFKCPGNEGAVPVRLQDSYVDGGQTIQCDESQLNNPFCFRFACPITEGEDILDDFGVNEGIGVYIGVTIALLVALRVANIIAFTKINWVQK